MLNSKLMELRTKDISTKMWHHYNELSLFYELFESSTGLSNTEIAYILFHVLHQFSLLLSPNWAKQKDWNILGDFKFHLMNICKQSGTTRFQKNWCSSSK
jgi:hypothetical protein